MENEKELTGTPAEETPQEFDEASAPDSTEEVNLTAVFNRLAGTEEAEPTVVFDASESSDFTLDEEATTVFAAAVEPTEDIAAAFAAAAEDGGETTTVFETASAKETSIFSAPQEETTTVFEPTQAADLDSAPTVVFSGVPTSPASPLEEIQEQITMRRDNITFRGKAADNAPTMRVVTPKKSAPAPAEPAQDDVQQNRMLRLRELKRKIVAGPEKQYYTLNGSGVGRIQLGILCNVMILLLCCAAIALFTLGKVRPERVKLIIFSQLLALLGSGLLGSGLMLDGLGDLFRFRYSLNSTLAISFIACCVDAWFCLKEVRIPCCGAFVLEMIMASLAKYYKRTTEMSQMDTLRKASNLTSLVKEQKYYDKKPGILRGQGDVEDFMDTYSRTSGPEIVQRVYAFVALIGCIGAACIAGLLHGSSMAAQVFAASLMVATPASYFLALSRPAALLEKRLHMVGSVICGWQGVKKLCGRAIFPLRDRDLFPRGSTKLNGIKFYSERPSTQTVSYTASLIIAAGGGLVPLFRNLLNSRNGTEYTVENFRDYENGGIGGEVNGEPVLLGTLEFLQSMGVEIPAGTMVSQAIYVSIDGELSAVIAISYTKMRSAAAGIVSLCSHWKLKPLLLAGDFMLTDSFIRSKFSIRTKKMITPAKEIRASMAAHKPDPDADVLALVTRDDLSAAVYAVTGAMALRTSCRVGSFLHILGGLAGIIAMILLAYLGSFELLTPANVMIYQFIWLIPAWLATEWTRTV